MGPRTAPPAPVAHLSARALVFLAAAALAPYLLLPAKPLILDAARSITENPVVLEGSLVDIFTSDYWGVAADASYATRSYRPLVTATFALQARLFGLAPQGFHLVDMGLHVLGTLLVALLLLRLSPGSPFVLPGAALFAVHPALSEAVCSAVGRADLMASVAMLTGIYLHLEACRKRPPWLYETGAVLCGAVALASKEYAVAYPFLLLLTSLASCATGGMALPTQTRQRRVVVASFLVLGAYLALRYSLMGALGGVPMIGAGDHPLFEKPLDVRFGTAAYLLVHAARLLVVPTGLNYFYGWGTLPIAQGLLDGRAMLGALLVVALVAAAAWAIRRRGDPRLAIAAGFFLLPLAPSLNTVSLAGVLFAERYLYVPVAGFVLALVFAGDRFLTNAKARQAGIVAAGALALVFFVMTSSRVQDWQSPRHLAESSLDEYPESASLWFEVGLAYGGAGDHAKANESFERALGTVQNRPQMWREYAVSLMNLGRYDESVKAWRRTLELAPQDLGPLWRGLGIAELAAGQVEGAVRSLSRAHELAPADERVTTNLARALVQLAQQRAAERAPAEAMDLVDRALALEVMPPEGIYLTGLVAAAADREERAAELFALAVERDPDLLRKKHQMAVEFDQAGRHLEAAQQYREILAATPGHVPSRFNLGRSLLLAGQAEEAAVHLRRGLALREDPGARALLAEAERRAASRASSQR